MTLTAYVAQLLGVYLVLSGVLMIVREQAMMLLVPKLGPRRHGLGSRCLQDYAGSGDGLGMVGR